MSAPCDRWMAIFDDQCLGATASAADLAFVRSHEATCATCAREATLWRSMRQNAHSPLPEDSPEAAEQALRAAEAASRPEPPRRRWRAGAFGAGATVALAAGLFLWLRRTGRPEDDLVVARIAWAAGQVEIDGRVAEKGAALPRGSSLRAGDGACCVAVGDGVLACLTPGSEVRDVDAAPAHLRMDLVRGKVVAKLARQPSDVPLTVQAGPATIRAVSTLFSVNVQGDPVVHVDEGSVEVQTSGRAPVRVGAHLELAFSTWSPIALAEGEERTDRAALVPPGAPVVPDPTTIPTESSSLDSPGDAGVAGSGASRPASPAEMLARAQSLLGARQYRAAALAYRRLGASYPASSEAHAALVSLGNLELEQLGEPRSAIRSFEAYLKHGGGTLAEEAEYGRIRAFRDLGKKAEETAATKTFLSARPASIHATSLEDRLRVLSSDPSEGEQEDRKIGR